MDDKYIAKDDTLVEFLEWLNPLLEEHGLFVEYDDENFDDHIKVELQTL